MFKWFKKILEKGSCPRCGGRDFQHRNWGVSENYRKSHKTCRNCFLTYRYNVMNQGAGVTTEDEGWEIDELDYFKKFSDSYAREYFGRKIWPEDLQEEKRNLRSCMPLIGSVHNAEVPLLPGRYTKQNHTNVILNTAHVFATTREKLAESIQKQLKRRWVYPAQEIRIIFGGAIKWVIREFTFGY